MVFRENNECANCRGHGVIRVKSKGGATIVEAICSCSVGRMIAKTHVPVRPAGVPKTATIRRERVHG